MPIPLEKIIESAQRSGFESELRAASIISNEKWTVNQNVYFIDKDEGKGRELDILSYRIFRSTKDKPELNCMIVLCIEVKKTADPFIFYSSKTQDFEGSRGFGVFHWKHNIDNSILHFQDIELKRPMAKAERTARSYSSFKSGQTQHIQAGVISAFKATVHERDNCEEKYSDNSGDICFFIPIVLVDGPLYECFFQKGETSLTATQVEELLYLQNYHSKSYGRLSNNVYVMNLNQLGKKMSEFDAWGDHMLAAMVKNRSILAAKHLSAKK